MRSNQENTFGTRLRRLRLHRRLSLKEMASAIGIPVTTYREWEYGRAIKGEPYPRIAEVLGVGLTELLTGRTPSRIAALKQLTLVEDGLAALKKELESLF